MTPLDLILLLIVALFVVYLVIVAASEPRTTWRNYMTLDDKLAELQAIHDGLVANVFAKLIPALESATRSMMEFSDSIENFGDTLRDDEP